MIRLLGWLFGFGVFLGLAGVAAAGVYLAQVTQDLPDYTVLKDYQPPVTTRVHAADGTLLAEYARERRLFQPIETIPPVLKRSSRCGSSRRSRRTRYSSSTSTKSSSVR
jgi:penicillin-binding protein 1A